MEVILNLDENFSPFGSWLKSENFIFPGGECHVKLYPTTNNEVESEVLITTRIRTSDDFFKLLLATDALKREGYTEISVLIPYLPYARQDRVMVPGEPLSVKVFAGIINSQSYRKVTIFDPHSDVCGALINNCEIITNHAFVKNVLNQDDEFLIVSPDAGAYKKIFKLCQYIGYDGEIIMANKIRDLSNGVIRSLTVSHNDMEGRNCYIIDDICDGGGTFTLLAQELKKRNAGHIYLIVTHGILSKGCDLFGIDHIYTTNSFRDLDSPNITQIKLNHGLLS